MSAQWKIICDDILNWCKTSDYMAHAILVDSPYHLHSGGNSKGGFMNATWDGGGIAFQPSTWAALAEHLLPGGFIMAFGGARTFHRLACAIEDAGLVLNSALFLWANGSGFPKASNIHIQLEKRLCYKKGNDWYYNDDDEPMRTKPPFKHPDADKFYGHRYGTQCLKPSGEPVVCAMKPLTIWQKCGILVEEITSLMEVFLCQFINVQAAEGILKELKVVPNEASESSVPASAFLIQSVLSQQQGFEQMDMWRLSEGASIPLSIVSLWNNILGDLWNLGSSCTTLTEIQVITVLKTLRSWLLANTSNTIIQVVFPQSGQLSNVPVAEGTLNGSKLSSPHTQKPIAQEPVIGDSNWSDGGESANNVAKNSTLLANSEESQDFTALLSAIAKAERSQAELTQLAKCAASLLESHLGQLRTSSTTNVKSAHGENRLEPIIVAQKPWTGKRLDCIVRTGAGALNIDAARIHAQSGDRTDRIGGTAQKWGTNTYAQDEYSINVKGSNSPSHPQGRWPSNFCLIHSEGCERVGVKRVKGTGTAFEPQAKQMNRSIYGGTNTLGRECSYADPDGMETIDDFQCVPECPVARLDEQTKGQRCHKQNTGNDYAARKGSGMFLEGTEGLGLHRVTDNDSVSGPSRFFQQSDWSHEVAEQIAGADPVRYQAKAAKSERGKGLADFYWVKDKKSPIGFVRVGKEVWENPENYLKLRDDLSEEERQYVIAELQREGVNQE